MRLDGTSLPDDILKSYAFDFIITSEGERCEQFHPEPKCEYCNRKTYTILIVTGSKNDAFKPFEVIRKACAKSTYFVTEVTQRRKEDRKVSKIVSKQIKRRNKV